MKPARACSFVAGEPRLTLVCPIPDNLPKVNLTAMERSRKIFLSPKRFPELRGGRQLTLEGIRRQRVFRETKLWSLSLVAQRVMMSADRVTNRVGAPYRDTRYVKGLGIERIARDTGLNESQVRRRLVDGEALGWWSIKRGRESYMMKRDDGHPCKCCPGRTHFWGKKRWAAKNAVIRINPVFIARLGLTRRWAKESTRAVRVAGERRRIEALNDVQQIQWERQRQAMAAKSATFQAEFAARNAERLSRLEREELARIMRKLMLEHPDWGPALLELEARKRL
jgi:hypothetical protein